MKRSVLTAALCVASALYAFAVSAQTVDEDEAWLVDQGNGLYLWAWANGNYAAVHNSADPFSNDSSGWQLGCKTDIMTDQESCFISSIAPIDGIFGGLAIRFGQQGMPLAVCVEGHDFPGATAMIRVDKLPAITTNEHGCVVAETVLPQMLLGEEVIVRRVSLPRGVSFDKALTLKGFPQALQGVAKIKAGTLVRNHRQSLAPQTSVEAREVSNLEPPRRVAKLIDAARDLDRRCRGTEGANPSSTVCDERNAAFTAVNDVGWCYGKDDQVGYQYEWHPCGPDSIGR